MRQLFLFELAVCAAAAAAAAWFYGPPWLLKFGGWKTALLGLPAAAVPLFLGAWALSKRGLSFAPIKRIYLEIKHSSVGAFAKEGTAREFAAVSLLAGIGEELLFRGLIQDGFGLWAAALVFGALHALTPGYFIAASAFGVYLGILTVYAGSIGAAAVCHFLYDFLILLLYRWKLNREIPANTPD